ncbi:Gfo/Idh/MocA family protein [Limnoglobus roseus]|uniref:Putative Rossmann-fold-type glycoside hydrolase n=1 Tax=Limnoglobus roseus TaxID=2598579 RepID=A0A5C1ASJ3_9BACT|nr:Gfo/Idh/MocA family oxidoreductase [Limnoglobus roseus]QEL21127.1 putative Rossmann-fold-type glycoside hydrolase [Limnoglobus roseus]
MKALGVAVVGTGFIGPVHVEAVRRLGHRVVGILGSSPEKSRVAADQLGLEKGYASLAGVLADDAVQVVHLASPNVLHFPQCRQVLAAGKHVVCEKPLAMTTAESAELVKLAVASPVVAAVNYNVRFYPLVLEARERVRAGGVGRVFHVSGSYLQDWLLYPTDFNWRVRAEDGGGLRAFADIGTHWIDTVCFITGLEVEAVFADLQTVHPTRQQPTGGGETFTASANRDRRAAVEVPVATEDAGSLLLRFRGGAKGSLTVSQVTAGRKNCLRFDIAGAEASLVWDSEEPNALHIGYRTKPNERLIRDPALMTASVTPFANYPGGHAEGFPDTFKQLYRAVYADVTNGRSESPLYATFADGHREVQLCEAILRSHREEKWVTV